MEDDSIAPEESVPGAPSVATRTAADAVRLLEHDAAEAEHVDEHVEEMIVAAFHRADVDGSGEIDYDEFVRFCQECQLDPAADTLFVDKAVLLEQLQTENSRARFMKRL